MEERTRRRPAPLRRRAFLDALADDAHAATDALLAAVSRGRLTPEEALLKVLAPAAAEAGDRWLRTGWDVATGHRAAAAVEDAAVTITHTHAGRERDRGRIVVAVAEGETHTLPARLLGAALALRRWHVDLLAGPLSPADLTTYLAGTKPRALVLSATMRSRLPGAARMIAAAHEAGVPVVAGGAAFGTSPRRAAMLGADAWASTVDGVERVVETPREPRRVAAPVADAVDAAGDWDRVLAEAWQAALRAEHDPARAAWLGECVPLLLRSARAALVVEDDEVLVQDLLWLVRATASRFRDGELVPAMLVPWRRLLPAGDVRAHRLLGVAADRLDAARVAAAPPARTSAAAVRPLRPHPAAARGREETFDDLAFLASVTCGAPLALVVLADGERMVVKGAHGDDAAHYDAAAAWAAEVFAADAPAEEGLAEHPVVARHGATFLGQVTIRDAAGEPCGAVVVADLQPRAAAWPQRQALRSLARQAEARLHGEETAPALGIVDGDALGEVPADLRARLAAGQAVPQGDDELLRTSQVARLFHVSPRTINNWVAQGRLTAITTAGGHKRFRLGSVLALYREQAVTLGESAGP
ncbi:MAG TPA: cobalamin-dependent protein [Frankiaceae bacterium]|nr:cobalamin-dependent protein [Frankiaceae bacterium]